MTVIGILPVGGIPYEEHDGFTIHRLRLNPLYARIPRRMRSAAYALHRSLSHLPGRYLRATRRLRSAARIPRRLRNFTRERLSPVLEATGVKAAWAYVDNRLSRRSLAAETGLAAKPSRAAFLPLVAAVLLTRAIRLVWRLLTAPLRLARRAWERFRRRRLALRLLRAGLRGEERLLRRAVEFAIARVQTFLKPFTMPLRSLDYYRRAERLSRELPAPDVVHANDLDALLVAALVARRHRVPLVYDAQELYVGLHTLAGWYRRALTVQERLLIRRADRVTAVNGAVAQAMEEKYHRAVDEVILNCPPLTVLESQASGNGIRAALGVDESTVLLLYSGGFTPQRGLRTLILALKELEDAHLVLLGEGRLQGDLERLRDELDLGERISFTPFVHHLDVPEFIASADIGIIPYENVGLNHYLASPSKLFHYIMAGLPIACSDFPFLRTVVVDNGIGAAFDPGDPSSVAAAIRTLCVPEVRTEIKGRLEQLRELYSWEEQERRFLAVYDSLGTELRSGDGRRKSALRLGYSGQGVYHR